MRDAKTVSLGDEGGREGREDDSYTEEVSTYGTGDAERVVRELLCRRQPAQSDLKPLNGVF